MPTSTVIRARDLAERVFWTFISGFLSALLGAPIIQAAIENAANVELHISVYGTLMIAAVISGLTAAANTILVIARWRLSILPDPGAGLPGLPAGDTGRAHPRYLLPVLVVAGILFLLVL